MTTRAGGRAARILVVRHGETVANREGRFCGSSETELTARGREQAAALGRRLAAIEIHAVVTSGLGRAVETAAIAMYGREAPHAVDPRLREIDYGAWELRRESEVRRTDAERFRLMAAEDPAWQPPGGETLAAVRSRTYLALASLLGRNRGRAVLVVSHGTAIGCMVAELLGVALSHTLRFEIGHCALTEVTVRGGRPFLARLNDRAHLEGGGGWGDGLDPGR